MIVVKIISAANGQPTPFDDSYLVDYDPTYHWSDGRYDGGILTVTKNKAEATKFLNLVEFHMLYTLTPGCSCHSIRLEDGKPNRPLTAFNIIVESA